MKNNQYVLIIIFLFSAISACKTTKNIENKPEITTEVSVIPDFQIKPIEYTEKIESTDCRIIEMKQYEKIYIDLSIMPSLGCKSYNYKVVTMPASQQDTKQKLVFMLVQTCSESMNAIDGKKIVRIDLSEILSTIKNQKTIEISFTNSAQTINFNIEK
ncbi:MAG: hypothetical protein RI922_2499 [Bacteroidota bacterium]|jgi:hypothetical protein